MTFKIKPNSDSRGLMEFVRFCIVGVIATGIDAALFYACKTVLPYQIALAIGYMTSLIVNYYLTTKWTFKVKQTWGNLIGIIAVHLVNLFVVRMGLMYVFVQMMGMSSDIAYVPTLCISVVFSFIAIKLIIHKV